MQGSLAAFQLISGYFLLSINVFHFGPECFDTLAVPDELFRGKIMIYERVLAESGDVLCVTPTSVLFFTRGHLDIILN